MRMNRTWIVLVGVLALLMAACAPQPEPTATPTPTDLPTATDIPSATPTEAATATPLVIIVTATPDSPTAGPPPASGADNVFATRVNCTPNASWTTTYTVRAGDTVGNIASATGSTVTAIAQGNCIANANNIFVGQVLRVPRTPAFPTEEVTEEPTDEATEEPTDEATEEPTDEATEEPTDEATEEPTDEATEEPTDEATEEPTDEATEEPTDEATEEPTDEATEEPAEPEAEEATEEASS